MIVGMCLAVIYGIGELTGRTWMGIPQMARWHAPVNAFGFTVLGLLAHVTLKKSAARVAAAGPEERSQLVQDLPPPRA